jgi:hypothetical protein
MGVLIAYSSSAHRNLDLLPTREVPDTARCPARRFRLTTVLPARHDRGVPRCPAPPWPAGPWETPGGGPPGRDKRCRGAHRHPDRAAYREDRVHKRPRPPPHAADRSWPYAPGSPRTFAEGMLGFASDQTPLSLPPRAELTPTGYSTYGCSSIAYGCAWLLTVCPPLAHGCQGRTTPGSPRGLLLGVRPDVDPPAGQPGGEAGILPLLADGERELVVRHGDPGGPRAEIDDVDLAHPSR